MSSFTRSRPQQYSRRARFRISVASSSGLRICWRKEPNPTRLGQRSLCSFVGNPCEAGLAGGDMCHVAESPAHFIRGHGRKIYYGTYLLPELSRTFILDPSLRANRYVAWRLASRVSCTHTSSWGNEGQSHDPHLVPRHPMYPSREVASQMSMHHRTEERKRGRQRAERNHSSEGSHESFGQFLSANVRRLRPLTRIMPLDSSVRGPDVFQHNGRS